MPLDRQMVDKLLDRVTKLIALSSSPSEDEARTSAFLACKLIRENKLIVGYQGDKKIRTFEYDEPKRSRWPEPPVTTLAHRSRCRTCKKYVYMGEKVWYRTGIGVAHVACDYDPLYER